MLPSLQHLGDYVKIWTFTSKLVWELGLSNPIVSVQPKGFPVVVLPCDTDLVVLSDAQDDIVFQDIERVVHGVHC